MPSSGSAVMRPSAGPLARARPLPLRYPHLSLTLLLWLLGLWVAFLAKPPAVNDEQAAAFKAKLQEAKGVVAELTLAESRLMEAQLEMRQHQVWFWRFKPEARQAVEARRPAVDAAREVVDGVRARRDGLLREAKAALGLWSEAGVEEGRELFWESFASGKVFAQRQSFWDALLTILGGRERDWLGLLLQLLFQTLMNFATGLTLSVFFFVLRLPSLIWSYAPAAWSAVLFFCVATVAAVSVVAAYLGLLFGAGAAATYSTLWMVANADRQRLGYEGQERRRLEGAAREHHE